MWLLYVFIVSAVVSFSLLLLKAREMKVGRENFLGRIMGKGDPFVSMVSHRVALVFHRYRDRVFYFLLVYVPNHAEAFFRWLKSKTHGYYHGANSKMRNKQNIPSGPVSPYMRSISFRREGGNHGV